MGMSGREKQEFYDTSVNFELNEDSWFFKLLFRCALASAIASALRELLGPFAGLILFTIAVVGITSFFILYRAHRKRVINKMIKEVERKKKIHEAQIKKNENQSANGTKEHE